MPPEARRAAACQAVFTAAGRAALAIVGSTLAWLALVTPAHAAPPAPFGHECARENGVRFCPTASDAERVPSFDGIPLDVDVTLPRRGRGPFPTIVMLHGLGGSKTDFETDNPEGDAPDEDTLFHYNNNFFAKQGYAVVNYSARGFGRSCGQMPEMSSPGCEDGYIHLADSRFEVRDTQFLVGRLVDQGITDPDGIGVTGISYGGGQSIQLAQLDDQIRKRDGSLRRWRSPKKRIPLSIAAAYPRWPWSDLVYSLFPNGRVLDFRVSERGESRSPIGVLLESYVSGLFALAKTEGYICGDSPQGSTPCEDESADLNEDFELAQQGEPASREARQSLNEIFRFHQGFGLRAPGPAAPLLIENGWTDDLFPAHEALRIYNDLRSRNPRAPVSLQFGDLGHARGSQKQNTDRFFNDQGAAFFDQHLRGGGARAAGAGRAAPAPGSVTAFTQTCPQEAPANGPFRAPAYPELSDGSVRFSSAASQTVASDGGNPAVGTAFDPIANGDACTTVARELIDPSGTASYRLRVRRGFTLLGRPTVRARVATTQTGPAEVGQLDSRLFDVLPNGRHRLISRGAYRLSEDQRGRIVFQLNGNGYRFKKGHTVKLQLVGQDAPYLRPSNFTFSVQVSDVRIALPTLEASPGGGSGGGSNPGGGSGDADTGSGGGSGGSGGDGSGSGGASSTSGDVDCEDLTESEERATLEAEPSDPFNLDANGDGVPCEDPDAAAAVAADSDASELPFTGLGLGILAVAGLSLAAVGTVLRLRARR